jgi:hypothetical protein
MKKKVTPLDPTKPVLINQMELVSAIWKELARQHPGIQLIPRQMNTTIDAATKIVEEYGRPAVMATPNMGLVRWLASDDTGMSSRFMAVTMFSDQPHSTEYRYPLDADDFGRCYRMIKAVGEPTIEQWQKLAGTGPEWRRLVADWHVLAHLFEEKKRHEIYDRIDKIENECRQSQPTTAGT